MSAATVWRAEHNHPINAESRRRLCAYFDMNPLDLGLVDGDTAVPQPAPLYDQGLSRQQELVAIARAGGPSNAAGVYWKRMLAFFWAELPNS